ncbi:S-layer homology domain-containing protein [Pseudothermotoga thermarum]|uniref:SLH domain-containing protein n=1 Tax=Pseudothermotoga thermarum DSM 5069 TaxID=688269 RepID=F7YVT7_9THEM|nr:S-layer homology domain-containing protein [Pseudothermotoga thermarum]AEH51759.1 hypothetical protein Theth_1714 [Pseudothermotoga thermarum DSM 5069]
MRKLVLALLTVVSLILVAQEVRIRDISPILDIYEPVSFVVQRGIMELDENGNFRGGLLTTRFDIAQYLYRLIKVFKLEEVVPELEGLKKSVEEQKIKYIGVESAYKVVEEKIAQLESALNGLNVKMDEMSKQLALQVVAEVEKALSAQKIGELFTRVDLLQKQVENLGEQTEAVAKQYETVQSIVQGTVSKLSQLEAKQESTTKDLSSLKSEVTILKGKMDEQLVMLENLKKEVDTKISLAEKLMDEKLSSALNRYDMNLKNLASDVSLQRKELADLTQNLLGLKGQIEMLQKTIDLLEINATKKQVEDLQKLVEETRKRIEQTTVNLRSFEERLAALDISALEKRISELEARQKNTESSILTAYLLGGLGAVAGVLALIIAFGK